MESLVKKHVIAVQCSAKHPITRTKLCIPSNFQQFGIEHQYISQRETRFKYACSTSCLPYADDLT